MAKTQTLAEFLAETGEPQSNFAERIGATRQAVNQLLTGKSRPSLDVAIKIAEATRGRVPVEMWKKADEEESTDVAV